MVQAVKHTLARTDEAAKRSLDAQTRSKREAAQALFKAEIDPTLQRHKAQRNSPAAHSGDTPGQLRSRLSSASHVLMM